MTQNITVIVADTTLSAKREKTRATKLSKQVADLELGLTTIPNGAKGTGNECIDQFHLYNGTMTSCVGRSRETARKDTCNETIAEGHRFGAQLSQVTDLARRCWSMIGLRHCRFQ